MAKTLVEKWTALFPNGSPDAHRNKASQSSDPVINSLSDVSGLDNKYTSLSTLPTGRQSESSAISILWNKFCDVGGDSDASINHLTADFGAAQQSQGSNSNKRSGMISAMKKNVTVRQGDDGAAAGQAAFDAGDFDAFFAIMDNPPIVTATVKSNYRLGSVNPDGGFSSYTGRPMTNGGADIATLTLQQWRDGMG
jgi:hypothetical protein